MGGTRPVQNARGGVGWGGFYMGLQNYQLTSNCTCPRGNEKFLPENALKKADEPSK